MMRHLTWYFDFISPYAYLQSTRLDRLAKKFEIQCVPLLFSGLLRYWGQKGPAEIAPKKIFIFRQCAWRAQRDSIPYNMPPKHPFNPLRALRLAIALGNDLVIIKRIFECIWVEGKLPDEDDGWLAIQELLGITDADKLVSDPGVKLELLRNGEVAHSAGVFGVPTCRIEDEIFWGDDCLDMLCFFVDHPQILEDGKKID